jgi:hypothetical protein
VSVGSPGVAAAEHSLSSLGDTWLRFFIAPAAAEPLAAVRILTAVLGLLLAWSYAGDLQRWFGPEGMIPVETARQWRPAFGLSLFDLATTSAAVTAVFATLVIAFILLAVGLMTQVAAVAAAVLWASLLHRGPMLAGPADDCLAVLLWCVALGPSGQAWSVDRLLADRWAKPPALPTVRARLALALLQVHAVAIAVAGLLSQLKGDVWWDGTAAWWLAGRADSRLVDLTAAFTGSEYLMNLVTHAITGFEAVFAVGLWFASTQVPLARAGLLAWPLIGLLAGEPLWGFAMAIFCVPLAGRGVFTARAA